MKMVFAVLAGAAAGLIAIPAAAQTPTYKYLGLNHAAAVTVEASTGTGWMNICREREILRRDVRGRVVQFHVPMCNVVWIGRRYYHNGNYYADPTFATLIYSAAAR